jgi:hypothetical protein
MANEAATLISDLAKAFVDACPADSRASLVNELSVGDQQAVMRALAAKKIKPTDVTGDGSFMEYAPYEILRSAIEGHPEYCFDGKIWDDLTQPRRFLRHDLYERCRHGRTTENVIGSWPFSAGVI